MTTKQQALDAAKIRPAKRTLEQQRHVDNGSGYQEVRNEDFKAKREQSVYGPG